MRSWLNSHDPKWLISKRPLTEVSFWTGHCLQAAPRRAKRAAIWQETEQGDPACHPQSTEAVFQVVGSGTGLQVTYSVF